MRRRDAAMHPRVPYIGAGTRDFFPRAKRHMKRRAARGLRTLARRECRASERTPEKGKGENDD
jgi:hypothetical protein